jgi:arylsulfatase
MGYRTHLASAAAIGVGVLLGYGTATATASRPRHAAVRPSVAPAATATPCAAGGRGVALAAAEQARPPVATTTPPARKPNVVFIMGDDIGWFNIGAYHQGIMAGRTPHIDRLAAQGARFTDYYAEASCTAGRANFITGQLPVRTGLTTVGQAGSELGMPDQAPTIATALKAMGYATGQFGKNHLGDKNRFLPTVHGFDEFFGYLYHLDAMEDPFFPTYPQNLKNKIGPRNMVHTWATQLDDATEQPRWGRVGKQKIVDAGPLPPSRMRTVDDEILDKTFQFIDRSRQNGKPFFVWLNPTRMHVFTHLSPRYKALENPRTGYETEEAGMAQFDDIVGSVMKKLDDMGAADNTIVVVTTDNGAENFTWPDGGNTPFAGGKGTVQEGGFRVPCIVRWPGKVRPGSVQNGMMSGLDWFPTLVAAAGHEGDIVAELQRGRRIGDHTYKVHLDGYNQLGFLSGNAPSQRHEIFYFAESTLGAVRIDDYKYTFIDQPSGWMGGTVKLDWPMVTNLRLDPFERMGMKGSMNYYEFFAHNFWRFVFVQDRVKQLAQTALQFPPMQPGASFNLESVKRQIEKAMATRQGQ